MRRIAGACLLAHGFKQAVGKQLRQDFQMARLMDACRAPARRPADDGSCLIGIARMIQQGRHFRRLGETDARRQRVGRQITTRRQRTKRRAQGFQRACPVKIAEDLHLDRPLRQYRRPDLAETIGRCGGQLIRRARAKPRIAPPLQHTQIALQHPLRRGAAGCVFQPCRRPCADYRACVPARLGEFIGKEIKLIGQILGPRIGGKQEVAVIHTEIIAQLAARRDAIQLFLPKLALPRADQRHAAQRRIGRIARAKRAIACAKTHLDRNPARIILGRP